MKSNKKIPKWAKILIVFLLVIAAISLASYIFINVKLNNINRPVDSETVTVPPEEEIFETDEDADIEVIDYSQIVWPADETLLKEKEVINILLIGQDRRQGESTQRSDSMMIATINKKNNTLSITSLMRDMYVQIPGYSDNRINAAYAFGGMELLDATVEKNFSVHIDGNIEVDFEGFKQVVDKIGGIDIAINAQEVDHLTAQGFKGLTEGTVHMDGKLALAYSRIRKIGNADYERTERQRNVLTAAFAKIKGSGLTSILSLLDEVFPLVTTDLSNGQMIGLASTVVLMNPSTVATNRIPVNGTYTSSSIRGMSVLVPDLTANRAALKEIVFGN